MVKVSQIQIKKNGTKEALDSVSYTGEVALVWLGQAGFAIKYKDYLIFIDPYLSDYLAKKYAETKTPHIRLMPSPLRAEEVEGLSLVLCTHTHSDHMDPETLPVLAERNPECKFIVPRASLSKALEIGLPEEKIYGMDAGETFRYGTEIMIEALASAHEELKTNKRGEHYFLGYILFLGNIKIYHSGDCVPYKGLEDNLKGKNITVALLPVNGRDERRRGLGIPGNFNVAEAINLCQRCHILLLIPHHFGMFSFNTVSIDAIRRETQRNKDIECIIPNPNVVYLLKMERAEK
ncbi:MBL fold metallo-hydrolase [Candidatus Sumerlaeota bacterium]|nr:MBL fold metallo-hydrolase [Candidatus Sumerlaeota bacterium]